MGEILISISVVPHCIAFGDAYGFEQSSKVYTLGEFGEMADEFKRNYFNKPLSVS